MIIYNVITHLFLYVMFIYHYIYLILEKKELFTSALYFVLFDTSLNNLGLNNLICCVNNKFVLGIMYIYITYLVRI